MDNMTELEQNSFKHLVEEEWTATHTIEAWKKWHAKAVQYLVAFTETIVEIADIQPGLHILDLASGTGDPALTLARRVGDTGQVTATDFSKGMLEIAQQNAHAADLKNMIFHHADVHALPFADQTFDAVTCRLGAMYFWDCSQAFREIYRVLKPGGRAAFVVWGPPAHSVFIQALLGPFIKRKALPPLPEGAPEPFRFAEPGSLSKVLSAARFSDIQEEMRIVPCSWFGSPTELWQQVYDQAVPFQPFFDSFAPDERKQAVAEVLEGFQQHHDGQKIMLTASINAITGKR
jgi:ubiquinone/menaquinone biosynthesis C-methylase UbiE